MDIITHAAVGAATGAVFGYPIESAIMAVIPDMWLGFKRKEKPNDLYNVTHSLPHAIATGFFLGFFINPDYGWCMVFVLLSHIALDLPTHGPTWAPPLFWPFERRYSLLGAEWEWFNPAWWCGLWVAFIWIIVCLSLTALSS